jgi:hypothetical protein
MPTDGFEPSPFRFLRPATLPSWSTRARTKTPGASHREPRRAAERQGAKRVGAGGIRTRTRWCLGPVPLPEVGLPRREDAGGGIRTLNLSCLKRVPLPMVGLLQPDRRPGDRTLLDRRVGPASPPGELAPLSWETDSNRPRRLMGPTVLHGPPTLRLRERDSHARSPGYEPGEDGCSSIPHQEIAPAGNRTRLPALRRRGCGPPSGAGFFRVPPEGIEPSQTRHRRPSAGSTGRGKSRRDGREVPRVPAEARRPPFRLLWHSAAESNRIDRTSGDRRRFRRAEPSSDVDSRGVAPLSPVCGAGTLLLSYEPGMRAEGVEPSPPVRRTGALPLSDARMVSLRGASEAKQPPFRGIASASRREASQ